MKKKLVCVCLAVLVFFTFAPGLRNGFVGYDDTEYVTENPYVNTGIMPSNIAWAFTAAHSSNWHPLTWLSHALDCTVFGLNPTGHHLVSLLLHIINTLLLFIWLNAATDSVARAAFVAAVFGVHPLHVESVAWVAERKDVLSTFFWMLTLLAYTAYVRRPGTGRYLAVAAALAAGLLSKQMLVTVPLLLLVLDWWPFRRFENSRPIPLIIEKLPLLGLSVLASAAAVWAQQRGASIVSTEAIPVALRLSNAAVSYVTYLWKTVWPTDLAVFYPFLLAGIPIWKTVASLVCIALLSTVVFIARRRHPWLVAGWSWYLLTLLPVIGIVHIGMQSRADRYMYVPMIGLLIAVTWEFGHVTGRAVAAGLILITCVVLTQRQIGVWKDGLTLFTHALEVTQGNFVAHNNLGVELERAQRSEEALPHYREALRIKPGYPHAERNYAAALFARGERLFREGELDAALVDLREGMRFQPANAIAHVQAGMILTQQKQLPAAIAEFQKALKIDSTVVSAHLGLGVAFALTERADEAQRAFEQAVHYEPTNVEARYNLALSFAASGRNADAVRHLDIAIKLKPDFTAARAARAELLGTRVRNEAN